VHLGETARSWWRRHRRDLAWTWAVGLAVSVAVTLASFWGYVVPGETQILDLLQRLQRDREAPEVVIVEIDEASFHSLGARQPVSRRHIASVVRGLQRSGAAVVGLDVILDAATTEEDDAELARAILDFADGGTSRVVMVTTPPPSGPFATPEFRAAVVGGSSEVPRDADDHIVRNVQLLLLRADASGRSAFEPAFSLVVADRFLGPERERLGRIADAGAGQLPLARWLPDRQEFTGDAPPLEVIGTEARRINFVGRRGSFATVPSHVVAAAGDADVPVAKDNPFRGRIVLVGETFAASRDNQPTPYGPMDGVEIHANVVHMLLTRTILVPHHWARALVLQALFVGGAGLVLVLMPGKIGRLVCFLGAVLLSVPASYRAFERGGHVLSFVLPVFAVGYMQKFKGAGRGDLLRRTAARIGWTGAPPEAPRGGAGARDVSVLVADVAGVTAHLETLTDTEAARYLEEFACAVRDPIAAEGGSFEGPIGERSIAVFDTASRDHAEAAVRAALGVRSSLQRLGERWGAGQPVGQNGIVCVATGAIRETVGPASPRARLGEPLSLAARRDGGEPIKEMTVLVSEETFKRLARRLRVHDYPDPAAEGAPPAARLFEVEALDPEGGSAR
jgi:CHASE2 domain-containing sensor protein/class 3 adenylate cyclase